MKSPGFSMLEIIIVMMISTMIMTSLFEIYNQTARSMHKVQRFVFQDTQILTLKNRFAKDIAGLSAIWFKQSEVETLIAKKDKKEILKDAKKQSCYFYSANKGDNFDTLTFITTGSLLSFGKQSNQFIRVVYIIQPDPANKGLFRLMRKEMSPADEYIDDNVFSSGQFYELVGGIISIDISYYLVDRIALQEQFTSHKNEKNNQNDMQETKEIVRKVKQWQPVGSIEKLNNKDLSAQPLEDKDEGKNEDLGGAPVPKFIEMKVVFGQTSQQKEQEFNLSFSVVSTVDNMPKSICTLKQKTKKTED